MATDTTRDELAQLRILVDTQQGRLARLEYPRHHLPRRHLRRFVPVALVTLLLALVPLATLAAGPTFNDLNAGSVHNANIQAIADAGITKGCDPGVSYCPNGLVTREEMASFLARTAGLGGNAPVANARTAQTATLATNATTAGHAASADTATTATNATNAVTAQTATNATNAAQLNNQPAGFYQPAGQPIANATHANTGDNATTVGGYAPNQLVRVAQGTSSTTFIPFSTDPQILATVSLTAPASGFVVVTGVAS